MIHCLNTRQLQGYLEEPASLHDRELIERHLFDCNRCRGAFERLAATGFRVNTWLAALAAPLEKGEIDTVRALARVQAAFAGRPRPVLTPAALRAGRSGFATWLLSAKAVSAAVHIAAFSLLMMSFTNESVQTAIRSHIELIDPHIPRYVAHAPAAGGSGGDRSTPVAKGQLPKPAPKQFVPPMIARNPTEARNRSFNWRPARRPSALFGCRQLGRPAHESRSLLQRNRIRRRHGQRQWRRSRQR